MHPLVLYILESQNKSFWPRILCRPLYNGLKTGSSVQSADYPRFRNMVILNPLVLIFGIYLYYEKPSLTTFILLFIFLAGAFIMLFAAYGYKHRNKITWKGDVKQYDPEIAAAGGAWAAAGLGIYSLVQYIINNWPLF